MGQQGADEECIEGHDAQQQGVQHAGVNGAGSGELDRRRLMQAVPPVDGLVDDGDVDRAHQREHRAGARRGRFVVVCLVERDHTEVEKQQNQHGRQTRIPHPPRAPGGLAPDGPGDQSDKSKRRAHRGGGHHGDISQLHFPDQMHRAGKGHNVVAGQGHHRRGRVHVENAIGVTLAEIGRGVQQPPHCAHGEPQNARRHKPAQNGTGDTIKPGRRPQLMKERPHSARDYTRASPGEQSWVFSGAG